MKPRAPGTLHDALTIICALLGFERAREITGKSESHLRGFTDPDNDREISHKLAFELERECFRATGQRPLTAVWMRELDAVCGPDAAAECLHISVMDVTAQLGQLAMTAREILNDKVVTPAERDQLLRDCAKMRKELDDLEQAARAAVRSPK